MATKYPKFDIAPPPQVVQKTEEPVKTAKGYPSSTVDSKSFQQILIDLGANLGKAGADGIWGNMSRTGLRETALKYGVYYARSDRDGKKVKVAPSSAIVLLSGIRNIQKETSIPAGAAKMPGYVYTVFVQKFLNKLGYLPEGQIDQKFGKITQSALKKAASDLGFSYKSSRAFLNLYGAVIDPASLYLKLYQAALKGVKKPEPKAVAPAPAKPAVVKPPPEPPKPTKASDPDTWPPMTSSPKEIAKPGKQAGKAYVSKDVQYLLYSLQKKEGVSKTKRIAVDGFWGKKSTAVLRAEASKYRRKLKGIGYFNKAKSVIVNPGDLVPGLYNALVALREGRSPIAPTEVPPPPPSAPQKQAGGTYNSVDVQRLLISLGASIKDDNIWGPKSRAALRAMAKKYGYRYNSSKGTGVRQSKVLVSPPDLIDKLQKKLASIRAQQAADAAKKAKEEAAAKVKAQAEAEAKRKAEAAKAKAEAEAAAKEQELARRKAAEAKAAEEKARIDAAARAEARKKKQEAKRAARVAARKAKRAAEARVKAEAAKLKQQQAAAEAKEAQVKQAVSTAQAKETVTEAREQIVAPPAPVYEPAPPVPTYVPEVVEEEEEEVILAPPEPEPTAPPPEPPIAKAGMSPNVVIAAAVGALAIAAVALMGKKQPSRKDLEVKKVRKFSDLGGKYMTPEQEKRAKKLVRDFYRRKGCTVRFVRRRMPDGKNYLVTIPSCPT